MASCSGFVLRAVFHETVISTSSPTSYEDVCIQINTWFYRMSADLYMWRFHEMLRIEDHEIQGLNPSSALMSFGKALIYICLSPLMCTWSPDMLEGWLLWQLGYNRGNNV